MPHRLNKTRAAKEGVIEPSAADLIRPFVAGPKTPPRYALHFGTVDKVGVNPKSEYATPLAVCAYPLTEEIFDQFLDIRLPFAQKEAKYLFVLEIKPDARVFYSTERFFNLGVGPEYLDVDVRNVKVGLGRSGNSFSEKFFYSTRPSDYYEIDQYFVEGGTVAKAAQWGHKLWKMGIDVWVDANREGILHQNEPSQMMFFNPSSYRVVLSMDNPKNTLQAQFGRDWTKRYDVTAILMDLARAGELNLPGANLTDANLEGVILTGANLAGANLTGAKLNSAELYGAYLHGAKLNGANLTSAVLSHASLIKAKLIKAKLIKANLYGAHLNDANLTDANLTGADLFYATLTGANLTGADLTGTYLIGVQYDDSTIWPEDVRDVLRLWRGDTDLRGANLRNTNLKDTSLYSANLTGADLRGADLTGAVFYHAYLQDVQYDDSTIWPENVRDVLRVWRGDKTLSGANLYGAGLTEANLSGTDLRGANLTNAVLYEADLTDAQLNRADLQKANLLGAKLNGAKLNGAKLNGAVLNSANLTGANLTGAVLTSAKLRGAVLDGIIYDDSTRWPARFTPPPSAPKPKRRRRSSKSD